MPRSKSVGAEQKAETKSAAAQADTSTVAKKPRGRAASRPFPHQSFEEAFVLAEAMQNFAGSNAVRRLTLFNHLDKAPESGPSRQLITSASRYGLINGNPQSDQLQLTPDGDVATNKDSPFRDQLRSKIKLSIDTTDIFKSLYSKFNGQKLPSPALMQDAAVGLGISDDQKKECIEIFIINLRFVGLLQTLSGAERILTLEHAVDQLPSTKLPQFNASTPEIRRSDSNIIVHADAAFDRMCFFIGPIGEAESEYRKHSDLVLEHLIRPAIEPFGFTVLRADEIQNPGIINKQVFEYLLKSRLAIADLSFHNPNVFYELAIRHARNLPVIQLIRKFDKLPFDIAQSRTIVIDTTDIYSLVPKLETYRTEISNHIRRAIDDPTSADNPFSVLFAD